jgi:hypothetical protein
LTCRARVQLLVDLHLFLDLPRHMQPPCVYQDVRQLLYLTCSQEALEPRESRKLTRHVKEPHTSPKTYATKGKSPVLCLCYTISHGLGPHEPTVSQGFMQDIPSLKLLEPYSLHHGLTKRCVRLEKNYKGAEKRERAR